MMRRDIKVDFQVKEANGVTRVDLKAIRYIEPTEDAPKEFPHSYVVLKAAQDCLLVSYGQASNGKRKCLLWGLSGEHVNNGTECFEVLDLLCTQDMYDMTETDGPCQQYDRDEERHNKKAKQDEETL
ncbi:uncharacterized protein LOC125945651 [Dermacentor silvarum]|uniref:uncharacterized protein LOC125945651 n=1 Tax=Dermacentor silvarum TaxID=543639 RepID=UPI002100D5BD|nr:uncharacterized protein LOC125945651 [Dermacentor silvarum]